MTVSTASWMSAPASALRSGSMSEEFSGHTTRVGAAWPRGHRAEGALHVVVEDLAALGVEVEARAWARCPGRRAPRRRRPSVGGVVSDGGDQRSQGRATRRAVTASRRCAAGRGAARTADAGGSARRAASVQQHPDGGHGEGQARAHRRTGRTARAGCRPG